MHWRNKDAINAKRRLKYQEKKIAQKIEELRATSQQVQCGPADFMYQDERSPAVQRKALQRAKVALPSSPRKYVATVQALIDKSSPCKRQLFHEKSYKNVAQKFGHLFIKACHRLRKKYCSEGRKSRQVLLDVCKGVGSASYRSALLGFDVKTVIRHEKKVKRKEGKGGGNASGKFFGGDCNPTP